VTWAPGIYAHRLGADYGPHGSRIALERSLAGQLDGLETDVVLTADEEVVACHDPLLEISTADLTGWAHETSASTLKAAYLLDERGMASDQHPLDLHEILEAIPPGLRLQLDVKAYADPELARRTAERICEIAHELRRLDQVEVISFFTSACEAAVAKRVESRLVAWADYEPDALARWASERGIRGLSLEGFILSRRLRDTAAEAELTVSVGVVNTVEQLRALHPLEPEIIVTDRPHDLRAAWRKLEGSVPPAS
jgi:glycerophosphoryl diester phosphodiesterase